jgi:hypothetical protein
MIVKLAHSNKHRPSQHGPVYSHASCMTVSLALPVMVEEGQSHGLGLTGPSSDIQTERFVLAKCLCFVQCPP